MAKQTEFQKQLSDPRWQKKRLHILERDEWTCQTCGDTEATLTVHHKSYRMTDGVFADVWDYEDDHLITLCQRCHGEEEDFLSQWQKFLYFHARDYCEDANAIEKMVNIIYSMKYDLGRRVTSDEIVKMFKTSDHYREYAHLRPDGVTE